MAGTHGGADFPGTDLLAAAHGELVRGLAGPLLGKRKGLLQPLAEAQQGGQTLLQLLLALRVAGLAEVGQQCQGGQFSAHLGTVGTEDASTVACQVHAGAAGPALGITYWQPGAVERVPGELATQQVGQLGFTAQRVGECHGVARQVVLLAIVRPAHTAGALIAIDTQQGHALMHRHTLAGQPGAVVQALGKGAWLQKQAWQGTHLGAEG
ncbi:hypothetical protein D3C76_574080 [compost metagenome]